MLSFTSIGTDTAVPSFRDIDHLESTCFKQVAGAQNYIVSIAAPEFANGTSRFAMPTIVVGQYNSTAWVFRNVTLFGNVTAFPYRGMTVAASDTEAWVFGGRLLDAPSNLLFKFELRTGAEAWVACLVSSCQMSGRRCLSAMKRVDHLPANTTRPLS